jgi:hypothetical protein
VTVAIDPTRPPTRAYTDFDGADVARCEDYAQAFRSAESQYQRATHATSGNPLHSVARLPVVLASDDVHLVTNPRFPALPLSLTRGTALRKTCYDQLDYTAGDWGDLWYHAMYSSYTTMRAPVLASKPPSARVRTVMDALRARYFGPASPFVALSPTTTLRTLQYAFQHLQKGVFVRFRAGRLDRFLPFVRHNYTNTVYDQFYLARFPEDKAELREMHAAEQTLRALDANLGPRDDSTRENESESEKEKKKETTYRRTLARLLELEGRCARRYAKHTPRRDRPGSPDLKAEPNRRQWLPNNHFVNQATYLDSPNVHHFRYLFATLADARAVPDAEFVLNLRDYPVLHACHDHKKDTTTVYNPFPDLERHADGPKGSPAHPTVVETFAGGMAPILSHTGKDGYADVPLPTVDDVEHYTQRVFLDNCNTKYLDADDVWVDWKDKTVAKAVFRGSGTGRGVTPDDNQRLAVWRLAHTPEYADVLDVELTTLNAKPKVVAGDAGLQHINVGAVQRECGSTVHKTRHYLSLADRAKYKYALCLDGQTRADRMANELRTGALVVLPTPPPPHGGHRLWLEAFLTPLPWEALRDGSVGTVARVKQGGYTHVTVDDVREIGALVQWLVAHDAVAAQVVANAKVVLCGSRGLLRRAAPASSFLFDYVEGVVRLVAERHAYGGSTKAAAAKRAYCLVRAPPPTQSVVGIVVGFRDTSPASVRVRTAQLEAFCEYFHTLFPATWRRVIVVAEQAVVAGAEAAFGKWWDAVVGHHAASVRVILEAVASAGTSTLPTCVARNLALVEGNVDLAFGVHTAGPKREVGLRRTWSRAEAYRRIGEEKFNLGKLKNAGFAYLRQTYDKRLSHVVFTDIDMLPDHELAPWYVRPPHANELVALSRRGTVYDVATADNLPRHTLNTDRATHGHQPPPAHRSQRARGPPFRATHRRGGKRFPFPRHTHGRGRGQGQGHGKGQGHGRGRGRGHGSQRSALTRHSTPAPRIEAHARALANEWCNRKFRRFLGAAVSFHPALFEAINGYPNTFYGWGGEDDAVVRRLQAWGKPHTYTVPSTGRLIDLEMAQPVTFDDKLGARVKENLKKERLSRTVATWRTDGVAQVGVVTGVRDDTLAGEVVRVVVSGD